ncbi:winged helix-turn-helix transcriptional regulator [Dyella soli]|uniref:Transcriptional regulator n=1 Tax=Dyella soli TaxID=522319 RepID=A0A4R0YN61_9GAMM|nr:helix-turn-helix domain-containing protein [Dyella soli]TCI06997.1 transcriptional regulator [Dyella soli]
MQRKSFNEMQCPIARSLERVGEWWSILILRDAFYGMTRFDEFQQSLGIAPNVLSRRLADLVGRGLFERRRYSTKPLRHEYVLTAQGRDFWPVLLALMAWGNRHFAPEGLSMFLADEGTGRAAEPVLVDQHTGEPIARERHAIHAGPAANERMRARIGFRSTRNAARPTSIPPVSPSPEFVS